jgi:regulator of sirC expression with transglutaminase-like and TPR domain
MSGRSIVNKLALVTVWCLAVALSGCAPAGDPRTNRLTESGASGVACCATADTLLELIGQAASLMHGPVNVMDSSFKAVISKEAAALPRCGSKPADTSFLQPLRRKVFDEWKIAFLPHDSAIGGSVPRQVYEKKQGSCLGIALLMLLVAEKNGYPLHGVVIPGHFFVRYDDGATRRNIEPNASGIERSDEYYRERYGITPDSWYYSLQNLSKKEVAAVFYYMLGNDARQKGQWREARVCYETSLRLFPRYPDALGNLSLVFAERKNIDAALTLLDSVARIDPANPRVYRNRALLLLKKKRLAEAGAIAGKMRSCGDSTGAMELDLLISQGSRQ